MSSGERERVERRLAAVLAADVAGYSRLMGEDEEGTLAALQAVRHELADPRIAENRGRIVKTTGDGLLVEFASVVDAVRCAVEVQTAMAERNAPVPAGRRIEFRIGINLGDVIIDKGDIFGDGVNVAARLEALAEPGGICVSRVVRDQVRDKLGFVFEDMGQQQVKNIARPVHAHRILLGGRRAPAAPPQLAPSPPLPDRPSIAVLPFNNMSGDPEQEYFVDGITEDIITALSKWRSFFVIARNSSFTYKGKAAEAEALAAYRLFQTAIALDANLAEAHIGVVRALNMQCLYGSRDFASIREEAEAAAERAIALDDENAAAHYMLSRIRDEAGDAVSAIASARRAIELNANFALGYVALGAALTHAGQHAAAIDAVEVWQRLSPRDPQAFFMLCHKAAALYSLGRYEGALEVALEAHRIRPDGHSSHLLAASYAQLGRGEEAKGALAEMLMLPNGSVRATRWRLEQYSDAAAREHMIEGLRKAGLPEP